MTSTELTGTDMTTNDMTITLIAIVVQENPASHLCSRNLWAGTGVMPITKLSHRPDVQFVRSLNPKVKQDSAAAKRKF